MELINDNGCVRFKYLHELNDEYFESVGWENTGQLEYRRGDWDIEYMGTDKLPYRWRIDNQDHGGHEMLFLDLLHKEDLDWLAKHVCERIKISDRNGR